MTPDLVTERLLLRRFTLDDIDGGGEADARPRVRRGHHEVVAVTHPDNTASQAVARRSGLADEGLTDRYYDTTCRLFRIVAPVTRTGRRRQSP